jgi:hypothetical protein
MDHGQFDDLTRSVVGESGTRRALFRLLTGGAFAGLAAWLGLGESTEAKRKSKRRAEQNPQDALQSEGKRNKKRRKQCSDIVPLCPPCQEPR